MSDVEKELFDRTRQEKIAKLPKWAQEEIRRLESNVHYYKQKFRNIGTKVATRVFSQELDKETVFLPDEARYCFSLSPDKKFKGDGPLFRDRVEVTVQNINGDWVIRVQAHASIQVLPRSSNLVDIKLEK